MEAAGAPEEGVARGEGDFGPGVLEGEGGEPSVRRELDWKSDRSRSRGVYAHLAGWERVGFDEGERCRRRLSEEQGDEGGGEQHLERARRA